MDTNRLVSTSSVHQIGPQIIWPYEDNSDGILAEWDACKVDEQMPNFPLSPGLCVLFSSECTCMFLNVKNVYLHVHVVHFLQLGAAHGTALSNGPPSRDPLTATVNA